MDYKEILKRALKTFVQAFVPVLISALTVCDRMEFDQIKGVLISALISATAAGLSAIWNSAVALIEKKSKGDITDDVQIEEKEESPQG